MIIRPGGHLNHYNYNTIQNIMRRELHEPKLGIEDGDGRRRKNDYPNFDVCLVAGVPVAAVLWRRMHALLSMNFLDMLPDGWDETMTKAIHACLTAGNIELLRNLQRGRRTCHRLTQDIARQRENVWDKFNPSNNSSE